MMSFTCILVCVVISCVRASQLDAWTKTTSGCQCYFNHSSFDCTCFERGGCQCAIDNRHQYVRCDHGEDCGTSLKVYSWTKTTSGCPCYFDRSSYDCACCEDGGCQCASNNRHQCVRCGYGRDCGISLKLYSWTRSSSGCQCYFDSNSFDCACCEIGGCQCTSDNRNQCVRCGHGEDCGIANKLDAWTKTTSGCPCYFDNSSLDCACCETGGCQCASNNRHQCVQCGHGVDCGICTSQDTGAGNGLSSDEDDLSLPPIRRKRMADRREANESCFKGRKQYTIVIRQCKHLNHRASESNYPLFNMKSDQADIRTGDPSG